MKRRSLVLFGGEFYCLRIEFKEKWLYSWFFLFCDLLVSMM